MIMALIRCCFSKIHLHVSAAGKREQQHTFSNPLSLKYDWIKRNAEEATLVFLCELGSPSYAITDEQDNELSDRWEEAKIIKASVEDIWAELSA
jgi:hypothetical protein